MPTFRRTAKPFLILLLGSLSGLAPGPQVSQSASAAAGLPAASPADLAAIRRLMEEYHSAVVAHDGARVVGLFVSDKATLVSAPTPAALVNAQAAGQPVARPKVTTAAEFARFVGDRGRSLDPRHGEVAVRTDGTVADAYFAFSFLIDGKAQNRGHETWQLVTTDAGWRIVSIAYSSRPG